MPATLASLVRTSALGLTVLAGGDRLDAAVRWVHTSELDDPTPYLEGGELLLTTGLKLGTGPEALTGYVHRLADAGVVGLGFGVGLGHDTVPAPLVTAAGDRGLPLLQVPRPTPFIAISKAVSAALAADQYREVTAGLEAQRELTRAALTPDGPRALLARLAAHLDGWAALYDASGGVVDAAPDWAGRRAARLAGEIERLRDRPAPASAAVAGPGGTDDRVEIQSLGTGRRPRGFLAVGTGERLATSDRYVVHAAVALLTLSLEQSRTVQDAQRRFGAALLRMLLAGEPGHARTVAGRLYGDLLERPLRVLVAEPVRRQPAEEDAAPAALGLLAERAETAAGRAAEAVLATQDGPRLTVLAAADGAVLRACVGHLEEHGELAAGLSTARPAEELPAAGQEAQRALAVARRRGRTLVGHDEVGAGSVLPLLGDDAVRAFAEGLLRPLREHDATSRGDLVASLSAWLSRHGQWDAAAADLGVHRHTLRYRMRRVEEILGRSLDDPDVRMELWLALKSGA
ncbi:MULTISPECIES: PucR family transcriptional regulator [Streptomycetaceae]|uniref:Regulatory protein n=1 Tax=Streptantibioticus cattleyicolor (strain ATCC 35852 / DSM 46488 / JCM 4925 / NBRC 14057 / NRRL 8057) TaxID=1003195 RepID=F8JTS0_STREN|nr:MULTISPECIES: PucR family transcriptional regulator [Streptomycetaceae]AEW96840.1 regulatory protein [Streptantibioticus cattleyicolor NRRL 8057 = DSM 46488]MYS61321.1 PucR family transcriptional regulator [Streptomyces sp. SID5468]CCB77170.1 Regulatory protein [Streptantibioticus cattleyicolor NRRL 8057 = DSM 46488]